MERSFLGWMAYIFVHYARNFAVGTAVTLLVSTIGTFIGFLIGFVCGVITAIPLNEEQPRFYRILIGILQRVAKFYVLIFRGTPMIVQAMVVYYGVSSLFGIDFSPFTAAILVLSLNTGSYAAEIVRGGINSVDKGQTEGAQSIGMSHLKLMYYVVLPQAFKNTTPQLCNLYVTNIKDTSVLNVISVTELFFVTKTAAGTYFKYFEAYSITALIYLFLTIIITKLLSVLEKRLQGDPNYTLVDEAYLKERLEKLENDL